MRPRGRRGRASTVRTTSGRPKARVLPEPVLAFPHTSTPASASGMVSAWTGNGLVIPASARVSTKAGETPSVLKLVIWGTRLLLSSWVGLRATPRETGDAVEDDPRDGPLPVSVAPG